MVNWPTDSRQKLTHHTSCTRTVNTDCQTLIHDPTPTLQEWPGPWGASSCPQPRLVWSHSRLQEVHSDKKWVSLPKENNCLPSFVSQPHTERERERPTATAEETFPALFEIQQTDRDTKTTCRRIQRHPHDSMSYSVIKKSPLKYKICDCDKRCCFLLLQVIRWDFFFKCLK